MYHIGFQCSRPFLQQLISSSAEERTADQLKKESVYIAGLLDAGRIGNKSNETVIRDAGRTLGINVAVLNEKGDAVYHSGSHADDSAVKEFISHNKSEEAVQSKSKVIRGTAVKNDAGKIAGYVLVSSEINGGSSVTGEMWGMLAASLCTAFIIIVFFYTNMTSRYKNQSTPRQKWRRSCPRGIMTPAPTAVTQGGRTVSGVR